MNREYIYHEATMSLCSSCLKQIPAKIIFEDGKVYILKQCAEHGIQKELLESDAQYYQKRRKYDKPGTASKTQTEFKNGCPYDCGLCPSHDQHSCITLIEVTGRCDLGCPICYANSGNGSDLSLEEVDKMLSFVQETENNNAEVLQISGGEPTLHKDIIKIIELARNKPFKYVMLNTNGLRIANDIEFVKQLSQFIGRFEIYLQFDSLDKDTVLKMRGRDILDIKLKAIKNLADYNIPTTLVMTVENGINDNELGQIISFAINSKTIRGINIQPITYFGRFNELDLKDRSNITDIIHKIESQTKKMLVVDDFIPLPCNVERVSLTYLYKKDNKFVPLTRSNIIESYLPHINNTFIFNVEEALKDGKEIIFGCCNVLNFLKDFRSFIPKDFMKWDVNKRSEYVSENTFRISITSFIDRYNFDLKSMQKECVHIVTKDLKRIPFSSYNMIWRDNNG